MFESAEDYIAGVN